MNIWAWIDAYAADAVNAWDTDRVRLVNLSRQALSQLAEDHESALATLDEGQALADALGETRWHLFYEHWRLQILLYHRRDYREALLRARAAAGTARRAEFADLPQRVCLHDDLLNACLSVDPVGYEDEITEGLAWMEREMDEDCECRFCLHNLKIDLARKCGRRTDALGEAKTYLMAAQNSSFHLAHALLQWCGLAYEDEDWEALRYWAGADEEPPFPYADDKAIAERLMWRAVAARRSARPKPARMHYLASRRLMKAKQAKPGEGYFTAWAAYFEAGEEPQRTAHVLRRAARALAEQGQEIAAQTFRERLEAL